MHLGVHGSFYCNIQLYKFNGGLRVRNMRLCVQCALRFSSLFFHEQLFVG
jgi:hypothetical protein